MSGKKAQRTKGNVKPSSSSRAANFLHQEGQSGFIGFSGLSGNNLGYVPQVKSDDNEVSGELQMLLRKMTKKDTVTKLKATQGFTELCKSKEDEAIENILSFWPRIYHKLSNDFDHRVREAAQKAHFQIVTKAGKKMALHLKLLITDWLMSHFDTYSPAATIAKSSFDQVFQEKKRKEVFSFCKKEILETLQNQISNETMDTLSDPKVVPLEEREAKFSRFISSSFHSLSLFIQTLDSKHFDDIMKQSFVTMFSSKKFWNFSKHTSSMIRNSFYTFLCACCQSSIMKSIIAEFLSQLCPTVLTHLDEQGKGVVKSMWDAALLCLSNFQECWSHVNSRKAVLPGLWKLLRNCGFENVQYVYPNLLPFITNISDEVIGDYVGFFTEFLTNFLQGLHDKQENLTEKDAKLVIKSYMECIRYLMVKKSNNNDLVDYLVNVQLGGLITELFTQEPKQIWHKPFLTELRLLLSFISSQTSSDNIEKSNFYKTLELNIWCLTQGIIVSKNDSITKFCYTHSQFFDSLNSFLLCFCKETREEKNQGDFDLQNVFNGHLYMCLESFVSAHLCLLDTENTPAQEDFIELMILTLHEPLLVHALKMNVTVSEELNDTLVVVKSFAEQIIKPLILKNDEKDGLYIEALSKITQILQSVDKTNYLDYLFQEYIGDVPGRRIRLLLEIFKNSNDSDITIWLKTDFVQNLIINASTSSLQLITDNEFSSNLWNMYEVNMDLVRDNGDHLKGYAEKLLRIIKSCLHTQDVISGSGLNRLLHCFQKLSSNQVSVSELYVDVLVSILKTVTISGLPSSFDECLKASFGEISKCAYKQIEKIFDLIVGAYPTWLEAPLVIQRLCDVLYRIVDNLEEQNAVRFVDTIVSSKKVDLSGCGIEFYSTLLSLLYTRGKEVLEKCDLLSVCNLAVDLLWEVVSANGEIDLAEKSTETLISFVMDYEELHKKLFELIVSRSQTSEQSHILSSLLQLFKNNSKLSEELLDECMVHTQNAQETGLIFSKLLAIIISYQTNVSCVRALVEKYADEFHSNPDLKNNYSDLTKNLTVLTASFKQWYNMLATDDDTSPLSVLGDYHSVLLEVLDTLLVWKEDHSDVLFHADLLSLGADSHEDSDTVISLNGVIMEFLNFVLTVNFQKLRKEHWDFILCSLLMCLQTCEDCSTSLNRAEEFFLQSLQWFYVASSLFTGQTGEFTNRSPYIGLHFRIHPNSFVCEEGLKTEWEEFFAPAASKSVLNLFKKCLDEAFQSNVDEFSKILCACCRFIQEPGDELKEMFALIQNGSWCYKLAGCQFLSRNMVSLQELCTDLDQDENHEDLRSPPERLLQLMEESRNETLKCLNEKEASITSPAKDLTNDNLETTPNGKTSLLAYLLSWQLILQVFQNSTLDNRAKLANYFHRNKHVDDLATCLFCVMPSLWENGRNEPSVFHLTYKELQDVAINLLKNAMQCVPALLRHWFKNHLNRNEGLYVDKFVTALVSPHLLKNEFSRLDNVSKTFDNMVVKTRPGAREVVAVYTIDEISMELVVKLSANHPLSPVTVECGKRIGVSTSLWRQWMLQLTTFLSFQNGTILDGLTLWKRNVDKRFEGVDECMICFSVIHGSNYSLPSVACKTCKKKFHPACLYKWFSTSGKSQCPLCRNIF